METRFEEPGSLPAPGPLGRLIRLGWGLLITWGAWAVYASAPAVVRADPPAVGWAVPFVLALWQVPAVVNLGWGVSWGSWPRHALAAGLPGSVLVNWTLTGATWSPTLGWLWLGMVIYTFGHLGLSFLLAAVLGTPGCELRALPHAWCLLTGQEAREHFCPGHIDTVDAWERRWRDETPDAEHR